jgi:GDP-L-fucose synthase
MYLQNNLVFVAGATGIAGSGILGALLRNHPTVRIRASWFRQEPFLDNARIHYVQGDLRDPDDCRRMVRGCDCAILAAANTGGAGIAHTSPWEQVSDNVVIDVRLLEACQRENVRRLVFVSTAVVYQEFDGFIREDQLDLNRDPHPAYLGVGWAKRFAEKLCRFWHEKSGLDILIARSSNIYGPYAKFDPATSNFIPAIIRKAVGKMNPFEVWGSPDVTRDVIYADDFGEAITMLLDHDEIHFDAFNVGSGDKTTVGEVVRCALQYAGHEPGNVLYVGDKPTTIPLRALDCSKIRSAVGWQPRVSVEAGIERTTRWWMQNKDWWRK